MMEGRGALEVSGCLIDRREGAASLERRVLLIWAAKQTRQNLQTPKPERQKGGKNRTGKGWTEASRTQIQKRISTHTRRVVPHEVKRLAQHLNVRSDNLQLIIRQEKRFERVAASGGGGKGPALDKSIAWVEAVVFVEMAFDTLDKRHDVVRKNGWRSHLRWKGQRAYGKKFKTSTRHAVPRLWTLDWRRYLQKNAVTQHGGLSADAVATISSSEIATIFECMHMYIRTALSWGRLRGGAWGWREREREGGEGGGEGGGGVLF
jgi:hypothetical protein